MFKKVIKIFILRLCPICAWSDGLDTEEALKGLRGLLRNPLEQQHTPDSQRTMPETRELVKTIPRLQNKSIQ